MLPKKHLLISTIFTAIICCQSSSVKFIEGEPTKPTSKVPQVQIPNGPLISGSNVFDATLANRSIARFLGLPYAQPPIGELRFKRPVPWRSGNSGNGDATLNATEWPNSCWQPKVSGLVATNPEYWLMRHNFSEDCLYLNIWTPEVGDNVTARATSLRPVLVFIHGGGFRFGSSTVEIYDGTILSSRTNSVVVTFNYRLNIFGFLYSSALPEIGGNQGLWDQVEAMRWVQRYIHLFGGDPTRVTIAGESAGSISVSVHILSPVSRDLFQNAIQMSGSALFRAMDSAEAANRAWASGIRASSDCLTNDHGGGGDGEPVIDQQVLDCLTRSLNSSQLASVVTKMTDNQVNVPSLGVVDHELMPDTPWTVLANHSQTHKHNFSLLISTVEDEASFLLYSLDDRFAQVAPRPLTLNASVDTLLGLLWREFKPSYPAIEWLNETIRRVYFARFDPALDHNEDQFRRQVGIALGDLMLACPTLVQAEVLASHRQASVRVHQLYYTGKLGDPFKWACSAWAGTCHANDLAPFFGAPLRHPHKYHPREAEVAMEWIQVVGNFLWNSNPGLDQWQPYFVVKNQGAKSDPDLLFKPYYEIGNRFRDPQSSFRFDLKRTECLLWRKVIEGVNG